MGNTTQTLTLQPPEQSGFIKHHRSLMNVSQPTEATSGRLKCPTSAHANTDTQGIASFLSRKRNVLSTPHSLVPFHNFIVRGKSIGGALPIRPSQDRPSSGLPDLGRRFLQGNTIPRKPPSYKNGQCTHTQASGGQHRTGTEKKALCGRETQH